MTAIENVLESIAEHTGVDAFDVRMQNLYGVGERNTTPYGQVFEKNHLPEILANLALARQRNRRDARRSVPVSQATRRSCPF